MLLLNDFLFFLFEMLGHAVVDPVAKDAAPEAHESVLIRSDVFDHELDDVDAIQQVLLAPTATESD